MRQQSDEDGIEQMQNQRYDMHRTWRHIERPYFEHEQSDRERPEVIGPTAKVPEQETFPCVTLA
jgi:hypothetical protein